MGKNLAHPRICKVCKGTFMHPHNRVKTCSPECTSVLRKIAGKVQSDRWAEARATSRKCSVCGGATKAAHNITCSRECAAKRMSENAKGKTQNKWGGSWCVYTPPSGHDMQYMLDIMHRKGYTSGQDSRNEKYTYTITKEGNIEWWDLKPSRDSDDWKASFGEEQPPDRVRVEQETEEESAYQCTLKELRSSFKDWVATAEATMGQEASDWIF